QRMYGRGRRRRAGKKRRLRERRRQNASGSARRLQSCRMRSCRTLARRNSLSNTARPRSLDALDALTPILSGSEIDVANDAEGLMHDLETAHRAGNFDETFDVIVVGFGFAGSVAAIEASRGGAKVLLLEKTAVPGGISICSYGAVRCASDVEM